MYRYLYINYYTYKYDTDQIPIYSVDLSVCVCVYKMSWEFGEWFGIGVYSIYLRIFRPAYILTWGGL